MNELDKAPRLELVLMILSLNEADASKKLDDNAPIDALKDAVAAFNSASVAKVASKDELNCSKLPNLVLADPLITRKLEDRALILELFANILVSNEADACKKLLDKAPIEALKEAVAAFNSASVAKVASRDELNCSRLPSLLLADPLIIKKLEDRAPMLELLASILVSNEADASKKLEDRAPIEALSEAVAALSSASVAKVASRDELNCSRLPSLVLADPLITK